MPLETFISQKEMSAAFIQTSQLAKSIFSGFQDRNEIFKKSEAACMLFEN